MHECNRRIKGADEFRSAHYTRFFYFLDHDSFPKTSLKLNAFKLTILVQATRFILSMQNQPGVTAIVLGQDECQLCYTTRVYLLS